MQHFQFYKRLLTLSLLLGMTVLLVGRPAMVDAQSNCLPLCIANGNVGIGTTDPTRRLEVVTDTGGATNHLISFLSTADNGKGSLFGVDTVNRKMYWRLNDSGDYRWEFQNAQGAPTFTVLNNSDLVTYRNIHIDPNYAIGVSGGDAFSFPYAGQTMGGLALGWFKRNNTGRGQMWLSGQDGMVFFTNGDGEHPRMAITVDGKVGIGNADPTHTLQVNGPSVYFTGDLSVDGTTTTGVLQITGGSDLAEPFEIVNADDIQPGMVVAIDPDNPGQLRLATAAYDRTVAGVVSGAGGINPGLVMQQEGSLMAGSHPVALSGRVYVYADAGNGAIVPGDLLTTSAVPGHAMKVIDYDRAQGAILGKAMSKLEKGTGLVLVLVTLQ